jgi:hypothetical protein
MKDGMVFERWALLFIQCGLFDISLTGCVSTHPLSFPCTKHSALFFFSSPFVGWALPTIFSICRVRLDAPFYFLFVKFEQFVSNFFSG